MPPKKPDPKDFRFLNCKGEQLAKRSGEVRGYDFLIDGCEDCQILLLDHTAQIFIDYCKRCTIVVGAVASSAFIRNCESCRILVCCGQLRTRDCTDCDLLVQVPGQPIIESSHNLRFGPVLSGYEGCAQHVEEAGLRKRYEAEGGRCQWTKIYDFSPNNPPGGNHWSTMSRAQAAEVAAAFPAEALAVPLSWPTDAFPDCEGEGEDGGEKPAAAAADAVDAVAVASDDGSASIEEVDASSLADGGFGGRLHEVRATARSSAHDLATSVCKALEQSQAVDGVVWLVALGSSIPAAAAAAARLEAEGGSRIGCLQTGMQGSRPLLRVACRRAASPPEGSTA